MRQMKHTVGPEHLHAIGDITVSFAMLEGVLESLIWDLASPQDQRIGQIITAELSFKQRLHLASSCLRHKYSDRAKHEQMDALRQRALAVENERNKITHSTWAVGDTRETITRVKITAKARKGWTMKFEQISIKKLDELAEQIRVLSSDITMFTFNLRPRPTIKAEKTLRLP